MEKNYGCHLSTKDSQICVIGVVALHMMIEIMKCGLKVKEAYQLIPGGLGVDSRQFGPWLRAAPFMSSRKTVIKVPSFFTKKMKVNAKPSPPSK